MSNKEILKVENLTKKYSGKIVVLIISLLGFTSIK
jgi:hypothetical protein